ncbi:MAG: threonine/serine exporter family protein [Eubacterium sp.]|jgi:uncharacterized membrane protein YjjP (DUF1212 family)|nr:threonine/serine exporter family protein [Eubacterium sp.]
MNNLEYILDFTVSLGCKMLRVGANLERVNDTMYRICRSYHLNSISIFSLNSLIIVSAKTPENVSGSRQISVHSASTHLEKLNRFNQLSRKVCAQTPPPQELEKMLEEAENIKESPTHIIILGQLISTFTLCAIYGGSFPDIIAADINAFILYWLSEFFDRRKINQIVVNTILTWAAGTLALLYVNLGIGHNFFIIITTNCVTMIPSISLVNAVRSILCGNEMNGILEFLKVVLESVAIVLGLILSLYMFGGDTLQWQRV